MEEWEKMRNSNRKYKEAVARHGGNMSKFLFVVGTVVGTFLLVATVFAYGYVRQANADARPYLEHLAKTRGGVVELAAADFGADGRAAEDDEEVGFLLPARKTNFLIAGVDDETALLTDTLMVGCFDRETKKIDLISIPRDTYTTLPKSMVQDMQQAGCRPPSSGIMKINAVNSYGGQEHGKKFLREYLELMLGIHIDYYVIVDTKAFRKIVEDVGGVEMEIPAGGLHYYDPTQNLRINVPGGLVHLNGEQAEGVVRYRATYREGDLQRVQVQHEFLKQMFAQVLNRENIINNAPSLLNTFISYVKTDFSVADAPKYLRYVTSLKAENLSTHTLPGEARYVKASNGDDISYFFQDEVAVKELIDSIFFSVEEGEDGYDDGEFDDEGSEYEDETGRTGEPTASATPSAAPSAVAVADKDLKIQVLNGGIKEGMAAKKRDMLENFGFNVVNIDTYTGTQIRQTRIVARDEETARRLKQYFVNVELEADSDLSRMYDIVVVLGLDES